MAHKIAIALTIFALFGGAFAATQSFSGTASSFSFAPTVAYDNSKSPDSSLYGFGNAVMFGNSSDPAYCWLYMVGKDGATGAGTNFALYRRKLFSANFTVASSSSDDQSSSTGSVTWQAPSAMATTTDQVAWALVPSATGTGNTKWAVQVCVAKSGTTITCYSQATAESQASTIQQLWCEPMSGNCYVAFSNGAALPLLKIMAVTSAGAKVWTIDTTTVATQAYACADTAMVMWANSTNTTNTIVNVAYHDCSAATTVATLITKYTNVLVAIAATVASPVTVVANTATASYTPCGGFATNTTNGLVLCFATAASAVAAAPYNLTVVLNPSTLTSIASTNLQYLNVTSITNPFVSASGAYYGSTGGFFLISSTMASATSFTTYYNTYNATGFNLTNGGLTLGTYSTAAVMNSWWITANSTLEFGYGSYDDTPGFVKTATAGAIAQNIYSTTSGNVLASFVAFIAVMIASLFAF